MVKSKKIKKSLKKLKLKKIISKIKLKKIISKIKLKKIISKIKLKKIIKRIRKDFLDRIDWWNLLLVVGCSLILISLIGYLARIFNFSFWFFGGDFAYLRISCFVFNILIIIIIILVLVILGFLVYLFYKRKRSGRRRKK